MTDGKGRPTFVDIVKLPPFDLIAERFREITDPLGLTHREAVTPREHSAGLGTELLPTRTEIEAERERRRAARPPQPAGYVALAKHFGIGRNTIRRRLGTLRD